MNKTKKIAYIGMFTALYVVLSATMRIPAIGNISMDLGYIVFAIACMMFGYSGIVVGVVGCGIESLLFSAYGISVSWMIGNLIVGAIFCFVLGFFKHDCIMAACGAFIGCFFGIMCAKTGIECVLYHIPFEIKIINNIVAGIMDAIVMFAGIGIYQHPAFRKIEGNMV